MKDALVEEAPIREMHRQAPIGAVPADTLRDSDVAKLLKFVAAVRSEREYQGSTVEQLAERAGIDADVLKRFEAGQAFNPTIATVYRNAGALGRKLVLNLGGGDG
jgi:ribosome-binding protein aMBF1 (putative translation factor)